MTPQRTGRSRARRRVKAAFLAIATASLLVLVLSVALALSARLPEVRSLVRVQLEHLLDDLLAGEVQLDRIAELSLGGVVVEGVTVRDPLGRTVLRAPRLRLGLDLRALLNMKLRFSHGLLEDARIRAIPSDSAGISLFEALAPPPDTTTTPTPPKRGGLQLAFEHIHVTHAHLYGDVPGLRALEVVGLEARGDIRVVHGELAVRVSQLRGDLVRPFGHAFTIEHATFALDSSPLRMHSKARVARGDEHLHGSLSYLAPAQGDDHLDLLVALDPVSGELLTDVGIRPAQVLLSPLHGHARLSGPVRELSFISALRTDGGDIAIHGLLPERGGSKLDITSQQLELAALIGYAPPLTLAVQLDVDATPDGKVALRLRSPSMSLYEVVLSDIDIAGSYEGERLTLQTGRLRFGGGRFDVTGWVDADADLSLRIRSRVPDVARDPVVRRTGLRGALRTDLRLEKQADQVALDGSLGIEGFGLDELSAKEIVLEGRASAKEDLTDVRLDLTGSSWGSAYRGYKIGDLDFEVDGKDQQYEADFELLDFLGRNATAHATLALDGDSYHVVLWPLELAVPEREPWRAKADLTLSPDGIAFHQVFLANGPQRLDLSGAYSYSKSYRVDATLQSFDLGGLRELSGVDLADLDGTIDGKLALTGVPGHPRIDAQGALREGVFLGMRDLTLSFSLISLEGRFDIDAELGLADKSRLAVYAGGEPGSGADWATQIAAGNYQFGLDFEDLRFAVAEPWLGWVGLVPPPGKISATVRGAGTLEAPDLDVKSDIEGLELSGLPPLDLSLDVRHDGARAEVRNFTAADEHGQIAHLQGYLDARIDELFDLQLLRQSLDKRPLDLSVDWKERRLDQLPAPLRIDLPMPSSGSLHVAQTDLGPSFELSTELGWSEEGSSLDACGAAREPHIDLTLSARDKRATGKLKARLDREELAMADLEADVPVVAWLTGRQPFSLPRTSFTLNASTEAVEEIPGLCEYLAGPLRVDISALDAFAEPPELRFELQSQALQLVAHASQRYRLGALRDARAAGHPFALRGAGGIEGASFTFDGSLKQEQGGELRFEASIPRALVQAPASDRQTWPSAHAKLSSHAVELSPLLIALPGGLRGSGLLEGQTQLHYDFAGEQLDTSGALALTQGQLVIAALGQELSDVSGRLLLRGNTITVEQLAARDFDGRLSIAGKLSLHEAQELHTDLSFTLRDFPLRRESAQVSRLTGAMTLHATTSSERTRAEIEFGELRVNLPNDLGQGLQPLDSHPDIFVRGVVSEEPDADPHALELRIVARNPPFRVLRSDLSAEVVADLTVRYRSPELTLQGGAEIKRGSFELYGKRFELAESRLAFDGGEGIDPIVSIDAIHRTGGDEIGVRVEGRVSDPSISFTHSNPAITEPGDIVAQLLGARSNDPARQNQDASGAAAGILAGATAGLITQEVRQEFGGALPVLSLESNSQSLRGARIRAGVQLDQLIERRLGPLRKVVRGAYVEGFVAPGASDTAVDTSTIPQSRGGGLLELRFPKDLVGTIEYRPVQNWRLDLAWEP